MTQQVEVSLSGVVYALHIVDSVCKLKKCSFKNHLVDDCPSQRIAISVLVVVGREEPGVVTLLHNYVRDWGLVVRLQLLARLPDRHQLLRQHCEELPLRHPVPEHDQPLWLPPVVSLVELLEQRHRDVLHILDDFLILVLSSVLDPHLEQQTMEQVIKQINEPVSHTG